MQASGEIKVIFLFEKWSILSQEPVILLTAYEDDQGEHLTQTLQHGFTNVATAAVSDRNRAADLGKLRPHFLRYQQERRQGH